MVNLTRFSKERIVDALSGVNDWLLNEIGSFSPFAEENDKRLKLRLKSLSELCLYLHLARELRFSDRIPSELDENIRGRILSSQFLNMLLISPHRTTKLIRCLLPFSEPELITPIADYYKNICRPFNNEILPFETLSHVYNFHELKLFDDDTAEIERLALARSALFNIPTSLTPTSLGAYSLTHSAFYASRFGIKSLGLDVAREQKIESYIDIELKKAFNLHNIDVALELTLTRICLFKRLSKADIVILESAISLVEETGFLLSPPFGDEPLFEKGDPEKAWAESYHTMLVFGLVLGAFLANRETIQNTESLTDDLTELENVALSMNAVGAIYNAVEQGNLPLAVILFSRLSDLPKQHEPSAEMLESFCNHVTQISQVVTNKSVDRLITSGEGSNILGMSASEFRKTIDMFRHVADSNCGHGSP